MKRAIIFLLCCFFSGCNSSQDPAKISLDLAKIPLKKLSQYNFFTKPIAKQQPNTKVIPYEVNSTLFSDYTHKRRFIWLPVGKFASYDPSKTFKFPIGTIVIKTFSIVLDMKDPNKKERILETRLLVKHSQGWKAYPYVWNKEQTDAIYTPIGDEMDIKWKDLKGETKANHYIVPNINDCKSCHNTNDKITPIGLKAKHLNRNGLNNKQNQLQHWSQTGILQELPMEKNIPRIAIWNDPSSGTLEQRARAYLDINCAHCHKPDGPANNSGLDLRSEQLDKAQIGIFKSPVAAGRGSGGLEYDIVPGKPEKSILVYRMNSTDPEIAMPEFGRSMIHKEGVDLISEWISKLK